MERKRKEIVIIGAGPGGLASAMLLAHKGFKVTVYEKAPKIGGRNVELELGPYKFDVGPTFLLMKYLLDELFIIVNRKSSEYLKFLKLDPMYKLQFHQKELMITGNREQMKKNIEEVFPGESAGLDNFYQTESKRFEKLYPCLQKSYNSFQSLLSLDLLKAFPSLGAGKSLYDILGNYFQSEELRISFTFQSKYLGMSPWECPGLFTMIPYAEHAHGVYHVEGGLSRIPEAFARVAQEDGAEIHCSTPIKNIIVKNNKAVGVVLESGKQHLCDEVIVNADFGYAVNHLFPEDSRKKWTPKKLEKAKYSCSTFMIYLGLDKVYDCEHHAIFFAKDYKQNLLDISTHLTLSEDHSIYVRNASINDPTIAPPGHSALYILAPMPNNRSEIDWEKEKLTVRNRVLKILDERTPYKNIQNHIKEELVITPLDWEQKLNVYKGATFNMGHNFSQLLFLRPHNKFEDFDNCYLVGGGTHPGSGLPTIFESARIAANLLSEKYDLPIIPPRPFDSSVLG